MSERNGGRIEKPSKLDHHGAIDQSWMLNSKKDWMIQRPIRSLCSMNQTFRVLSSECEYIWACPRCWEMLSSRKLKHFVKLNDNGRQRTFSTDRKIESIFTSRFIFNSRLFKSLYLRETIFQWTIRETTFNIFASLELGSRREKILDSTCISSKFLSFRFSRVHETSSRLIIIKRKTKSNLWIASIWFAGTKTATNMYII